MATATDKALGKLAEKIQDIPGIEPAEHHLYLHWLITRGLNLLNAERSIMVGGGAVDLYTSVRFATGDLDLVAPDRDATLKVLDTFGFIPSAHSKHFINKDAGLLVEIHGPTLLPDEEPIELVYRKVPVVVVSPEDCIVNRLNQFKKHGATLDLLSSFLLSLQHRERLDLNRLHERITSLDLWDSYRVIQDVGRLVVLQEAGVDEVAAVLIQFIKSGAVPKCAF